MRIGIDARFLTHPQRGGFKTYTQTVIASLSAVDHENEYILYTDRAAESAETLPANFVIKPIDAAHAIIREQLTLPMAMCRDHVDLAHFLCNTSPVAFPKKMVVTIHDAIAIRDPGKRMGRLNSKHRLLHAYWRGVIPKSAQRADLVITNSLVARKELMDVLHVSEKRLKVIHLAISAQFSPNAVGKRPDKLKPDTKFILAFAAMDGRKNHNASIEAFQRLSTAFPKLKLVLICSHPSLRSDLESREIKGLMPIGPVGFDELVWVYRNARLLVFPSLDEGYGLPPLEAMSCGLPVVASDSGSLPEVLGGAAMLVNARDIDAMTSSISSILTDDQTREAMIARGLAHTSQFDSAAMGRELVSAYEETMSTQQVHP